MGLTILAIVIIIDVIGFAIAVHNGTKFSIIEVIVPFT